MFKTNLVKCIYTCITIIVKIKDLTYYDTIF